MTSMHNFELSDEQGMILDTVKKLVQDQIEPVALEHDEHRRFVRQHCEQLGELGLFGLPIAESSGGAELGWLAFAVALEELGAACGSTARMLLSQTGLCGKALEGLASARETCEALAAGAQIGAFVGPEYGVAARPDGDGHVLSGGAELVTAAAEADVVVVAAVDPDGGPLLFCTPAASVTRAPVDAMGFRASAPGSVSFDDVAVGAEQRVASGGEASAALERAAFAACLGGGALAVGMSRASFELARKHVHERIAFGKPLFAQQAVSHKLVEVLRRTEGARHLVYHAARLADRGDDARSAAMMAKLEAVETAVAAADEAIQMHGGFGYTVEYHVERHYRDAKTLEVLDRDAERLRDRLAAQIQLR